MMSSAPAPGSCLNAMTMVNTAVASMVEFSGLSILPNTSGARNLASPLSILFFILSKSLYKVTLIFLIIKVTLIIISYLYISLNKTMVTEQDKEVAHSIRDLVTRMNRRLRKQISNPEQLSVAELNVIQLLTNNKQLLPSELCTQLNLSSQYISQVLNRLTELGYISRQSVSSDKRKSYAVITTKGDEWLSDSRKEREEWLAMAISKQYSAADKSLIQKAVALLAVLPEL
jgi:DNA-binding MarR family transcriptional regulator